MLKNNCLYILHVRVIQNGTPKYLYFAPKESGILGITYIKGEDSLESNKEEFDLILERAREYFGQKSCHYACL